MTKILRNMFLIRIRDKLYLHLKSHFLKTCDAEVIYKLVDYIIAEKELEIDSYLQTCLVKLENIDRSADDVVNNVLIPYVKDLRVPARI